MNDDPFRFCVFCGTDCYRDEPEHSAECPSSTGVFPAEHLCLPGEAEIDVLCSECGVPFTAGDSYAHRRLEENVYEPICLGCAAHEAVA